MQTNNKVRKAVTCPFSRDYQGECALVWVQFDLLKKKGGEK